MRVADIQDIVRALNKSRVRYLIVGGLAVNAHGYVRATVDVDRVIDLHAGEVLRNALAALHGLGYCPLIPEPLENFTSAEMRERWIREKGMVGFQMRAENRRETPLDIFVREPFDFDAEFALAVEHEIGDGLVCRIVRRDTLPAM